MCRTKTMRHFHIVTLYDLSPVPPSSGFRIWCNILKNSTKGVPDNMWRHRYLAPHWSDFSRFCIISLNLKLVEPDSDLALYPYLVWALYLYGTVVLCWETYLRCSGFAAVARPASTVDKAAERTGLTWPLFDLWAVISNFGYIFGRNHFSN